MNKCEFFSLIGFLFFLPMNCFGFSSELTRVVQDGLNGQCVEGAIIYLKRLDISAFSDADVQFVLKFPSNSKCGDVNERLAHSQNLNNIGHTDELILLLQNSNTIVI